MFFMAISRVDLSLLWSVEAMGDWSGLPGTVERSVSWRTAQAQCFSENHRLRSTSNRLDPGIAWTLRPHLPC
jgi:hypothetical protein